jgi:autotransporter translocation and assembly factor TamB
LKLKPLFKIVLRRYFIVISIIVVTFVAAFYAIKNYRAEIITIALSKAVEASQGKLTLSEPKASALGGIEVDTLRWKDEKSQIDISRVRIDPSIGISALLSRRLSVSTLQAERVAVTFAPSNEAFVAPTTLALPMSFAIASAKVGELVLQDGRVKLTNIELGTRYDRQTGSYKVSGLSFSGEQFAYRGEMAMADHPPYAMTTKGKFSTSIPASDNKPWPVNLTLSSTGSLELHQLEAEGNLRELQIKAKTHLTPFKIELFDVLDGSADGFDLAKWLPQINAMPHTEGKIDFKGKPQRTAEGAPIFVAWNAFASLQNRALGKIDNKQLPFDEVKGNLAFDLRKESGFFRWSELEGRVPKAAHPVSGFLDWRNGLFKSELQVQGTDVTDFFANGPQTKLSGDIQVRGAQISYALKQGEAALKLEGVAENKAGTWVLSDGVISLPSTEQKMLWRGNLNADKSYVIDANLKTVIPEQWMAEVSKLGLKELPDVKQLTAQLAGLNGILGAKSAGLVLDGKLNLASSLKPGSSYDIRFEPLASSFAGSPISGNISTLYAADILQLNTALLWRGTSVKVKGGLGKNAEGISIDADISNLNLAFKEYFAGKANQPDGSIFVVARLTGDLKQPDFVVNAKSAKLGVNVVTSTSSKPLFALSDFQIAAKGSVKAGVVDHDIQTSFSELGQRVELSGNGQFNQTSSQWLGVIKELTSAGKYSVKLQQELTLDVSPNKLVAGKASVLVDGGRFDLNRFSFSDDQIELNAQTVNLPVERLLYWAQTALPANVQKVAGWKISADVDVRGKEINSLTGKVQASVIGDGVLPSQGQVLLNAGQLSGGFDIKLGSLNSLSQPLGPEWLIDGEVGASLTLAGSMAKPLITAQILGNKMVLQQKSLGWKMTEGQVRARVTAEAVTIESMNFKVGAGSLTVTGQQKFSAAVGSNASADAGKFTLLANRVSLPLSPEQRVVLSGTTEVAVKAKSLLWTGKLTADEGLIELRSADSATDPNDVVIVRDRDGKKIAPIVAGSKVGAASNGSTSPTNAFSIAADLVLDLGQKIKVIGTGVDARLQGSLNLRGTLPDAPRVVGTVNTVNGTYVAYGQRLEIDRGRLVFNGPFDNPTLDILALRKNQPVEAGVALSGTALNPKLRLVSIPDRPDSEKLSWLVLGVGIENNRDNAQNAALQAATATFLGEGGSLSNGVAKTLGLDVLSIRAAPTAGLTSAPLTTPGLTSAITDPSVTVVQQNVVTLGKRLSSRLYVSYEQGLRGVWNLLKIQYDISNRLSLRAQTGSESALDLLLFYPFD